MSARRPTPVTLSLARFAEHGGLTGPHRDGWGIAFHDGLDVLRLREVEAAAESALVRFVEAHEPPSALVISHIRRATQGGHALGNTQPFVRELGGRAHVFAHNGDLHGPLPAAGRCRPVGDTDSERAFCALLARLEPLWASGEVPSLERRREVLLDFAARLRPMGPANFLYTDGDALFAHGHRRTQPGGEVAPPGLHLAVREPGSTGACPLVHVDCGPDQALVLFASVPLGGPCWEPLEAGELVAVRGGAVVYRSGPAPGP